MTTRDLTAEQVREMTRIAVLFFTGKESPQESPQGRKQESPQKQSPEQGRLFAAPETIRT